MTRGDKIFKHSTDPFLKKKGRGGLPDISIPTNSTVLQDVSGTSEGKGHVMTCFMGQMTSHHPATLSKVRKGRLNMSRYES